MWVLRCTDNSSLRSLQHARGADCLCLFAGRRRSYFCYSTAMCKGVLRVKIQRQIQKHRVSKSPCVNPRSNPCACGCEHPLSSTSTCRAQIGGDQGSPETQLRESPSEGKAAGSTEGTCHFAHGRRPVRSLAGALPAARLLRGSAQKEPAPMPMPEGERGRHKGPLSAETCRFGRPLSYSWAILFDVMDCLHVSVSNHKLHFVLLSTILYFPYSVPWPWLGASSQNTRRCQGKFSRWWKSCQA